MLILLTLLAVASEPFDEAPLYHRQTVLESLSPEMHWFDASYISAEWVGCRIGVPAVDAKDLKDDAVQVRCWFPSGRTERSAPENPELRPHYRAAIRAARRSTDRTRALGVRYVGTWTEVAAYDVVPVPYSHNGITRIYEQGRTVYALQEGDLTPAPKPGMFSVGGTGLLRTSNATPFVVAVDAPPEVAGTSIFASHFSAPDDPLYARAELAAREAILDALPAFQAGESSPVKTHADHLLPQTAQRNLSWGVQTYARPATDNGYGIVQQIGYNDRFEVPLTVALDHAVTWQRKHDDVGLRLTVTLDLPNQTAEIHATGPTGAEVTTVYQVELTVIEDGDARWLQQAQLTAVHKQPDTAQPNGHEGRHSIPATGDFVTLDIYPGGMQQSERAWTGRTLDYRLVQPTSESTPPP